MVNLNVKYQHKQTKALAHLNLSINFKYFRTKHDDITEKLTQLLHIIWALAPKNCRCGLQTTKLQTSLGIHVD